MIIVNKRNFSVGTIRKEHTSGAAPKSTYYSGFKICLVLRGSALWEIEDSRYNIVPGDVIFLNMGQNRSFVSFGRDGLDLAVFNFTREAFNNPRHFFFFLDRVKHKGNLLRAPGLSDILQAVHLEWYENQTQKFSMLSAKLTEFFIQAERFSGFAPSQSLQENLSFLKFMDYIDANITEGIDLRGAARYAGMSESTFSRHFLKINGISFKQYVMEKRVQHAIELLQKSNAKIIDIASDCGFESISGFYNAFQKVTGTTPGRFSGESI